MACGFGVDVVVDGDHVVVALLFTGVEDVLTFVVALGFDGVAEFFDHAQRFGRLFAATARAIRLSSV